MQYDPPLKPEMSFPAIRHAIFMNFISANAPIKEEDLTPEDCIALIKEIGKDYIRRNKRGIIDIGKEVKNVDSHL